MCQRTKPLTVGRHGARAILNSIMRRCVFDLRSGQMDMRCERLDADRVEVVSIREERLGAWPNQPRDTRQRPAPCRVWSFVRVSPGSRSGVGQDATKANRSRASRRRPPTGRIVPFTASVWAALPDRGRPGERKPPPGGTTVQLDRPSS